jgi:PadR family transcriptional regulator, regulatory protein PadR
MPRRTPGKLLEIERQILEQGIALQAADSSFYGFSLAKRIAESSASGGLTAHGTLYKALARMTAAGLLEAEWEHPAIAEGANRPRRRLYRVTGEGERALARATSTIVQSHVAARTAIV